MNNTITQIFENSGIIPLFYFPDIETNIKVVEACYRGGLQVVEFVNRGDAATILFSTIRDYITANCPGMILGAGSILDQQQALNFIQLGADFIVSPIYNQIIAQSCIDHKVYWIPGCATPTEISQARSYGAELIKIFPGNVLGPGFIKSVLGPMPGLKLMPTGGVEPTKENLKAWYDSGAVCVGMGSKLINQEMVDRPNLLEEKVKDLRKIIINLKSYE